MLQLKFRYDCVSSLNWFFVSSRPIMDKIGNCLENDKICENFFPEEKSSFYGRDVLNNFGCGIEKYFG